VSPCPQIYVCTDSSANPCVIAPTLIIVRVGMGHAIEETIVVKSATNNINAWQRDQHLHGLWYSPVRLRNVREYVCTYSGFTPSHSPPITSVWFSTVLVALFS